MKINITADIDNDGRTDGSFTIETETYGFEVVEHDIQRESFDEFMGYVRDRVIEFRNSKNH